MGRTNSPLGTAIFGESSGGIGISGKSVSGIGVRGEVTSVDGDVRGIYGTTVSPIGNGIVGENFSTTGIGRGVWGVSHSPDGAGVLGENYDPNGWAGYFIGKVAVKNLHITGGGDLAEPFDIEEESDIEAGTVMVIDSDNPGKLQASIEAYDKKVAGIVSGAGGVKPGVTLQQEGILDGKILIAISGRVYCKAEAFSGPIRPGELLTTSHISGYAMRVSDNERSQGAVLGKAMTALNSETGLVLVLVNLQ